MFSSRGVAGLFFAFPLVVEGARLGGRQVPDKFVLPVPQEGPGATFDANATRAATGAQIRSVASPDICFDVSNFHAGDDLYNLVPLALKKCDASIDGQKFDLITKGEHNDVPDGSRTLIVSSQQFTCVDRRGNMNDRDRPGLYSCGGRAAGDGKTTVDQQYFFNSQADLGKGIGFTHVWNNTGNGFGAGNLCLTFNKDGFASNAPCSPPDFTAEQLWIVGGGGGGGTSDPSQGGAKHSSSKPVGAIAGGVVGGVAFLALIILGVFFFLRRRRLQRPRYEDQSTIPTPFMSTSTNQLVSPTRTKTPYSPGGSSSYAPTPAQRSSGAPVVVQEQPAPSPSTTPSVQEAYVVHADSGLRLGNPGPTVVRSIPPQYTED